MKPVDPLVLLLIGAVVLLLGKQRTGMGQGATAALAGVIAGTLILMSFVE